MIDSYVGPLGSSLDLRHFAKIVVYIGLHQISFGLSALDLGCQVTSRFCDQISRFSCSSEVCGGYPLNSMYGSSTVADVLAEHSRVLLLECTEQIEPDNPNEICRMWFQRFLVGQREQNQAWPAGNHATWAKRERELAPDKTSQSVRLFGQRKGREKRDGRA